MATGEQPSTVEKRVIKRYSNRKLYDTKDSRYVTLQQIGEMVRSGEDVQIIDNKTKEDKTEVTLALILSEDLKSKPRSVPLGALRNMLSSLREGPLGRLLPGGDAPEEEAEAPSNEQPKAEAAKEPHEERTARERLNALVESSRQSLVELQQSIDERVKAVVPGIRQLRSEVEALGRRIEAIEKKLGIERDEPPKT
jgi:polyhydroxyalkanoate synthesis repressor PhaR